MFSFLTKKKADNTAELLKQIEELKFREAELQQRYQILTENLAASVIIKDNLGRLAYASPYTVVLTGFMVKDLFGKESDFFEQIVHPDDRSIYVKAIKVSEQGEPFLSRFRIIHQTGIEVWVEMRSAPIIDDNGQVEGVLAIILDVTSQVRYQKQVEERTRDLHDISYMISHDLRSPILTIKGMIEVLKQDLTRGKTDSSEETIGFISSAIGRLESLISSVLNYFKLSAQDAENSEFNLKVLVEDTLKDLDAVRNGEVTLNGPDLNICSDKQKCYRILSNLILNAFKYRDPARPLDLNIEWNLSASARDVEINIKDNGLGIPEEKLSSIFRPFQRAHGDQVAGFGVGLASVKKLVQAIGSTIEVESKVGEGSRFRLLLRNCNPAMNK